MSSPVAPPAHRVISAAYPRPYGGKALGVHAILVAYALIAILPVLLIAMNSFKTRAAIFTTPYLPPLPGLVSLVGTRPCSSGRTLPGILSTARLSRVRRWR